MASWNLYDQLNKITLGQVGTAGKGLLQGAADVMNRYGVGQPGGLTFFRGGIQQRPVVNPEFMRPDYSGAGERARRFQEYRTGRDIPGANTDYSARLGQGNPAAERAYQSEASRVAQLTAQDPELQRYEAARKLAVAPGATPEQVQSAEDIGMQIWAQKYGKTLAPKVKPGQAGYDVIQRTIGIQELPPLEKRAEFTWNQATQGPAAAGLVVDPLLNPAAPGFIGGEGPPPVNFADPRFENMSPEEFQKLLNQYTKR